MVSFATIGLIVKLTLTSLDVIRLRAQLNFDPEVKYESRKISE
jgi:hypothetical protein